MSKITLAHGGGGSLQNDLIKKEILGRFSNPLLDPLPDGAVTPEGLVISSDSFIITPRFFKGGDIGKLAVTGTVNDILMAGGIPRYLTCSLIIEEGFDTDELGKILDSMKLCADSCGVAIVTGDTKVVPAGMGDGLYINTAGAGFKRPGMVLDRKRFNSSDKILVSRSAGEHGISIMAERCGLESDALASDCAPLCKVVEILHETAGTELKFMRDATRGGVYGILQEIFENTPFGAVLEEDTLPVTPAVDAAAKLLGLSPGFAACEGCLAAVVGSACADECVKKLQTLPGCSMAAVIGEVTDDPGRVLLRNSWGALRQLQVLSGDQLPRIC